jgi:hypothetical protein
MNSSIDLSFNDIKRVRLIDQLKEKQQDSPEQLNKYRRDLTKNFASEVKLPARVASKRYVYNFSQMDEVNNNGNYLMDTE